MRKILTIGVTNLRRQFRVRTNLFFTFVFPMLLILVVGATFGGSSNPRLGLVAPGSGPLETDLIQQLTRTPHLHVVRVGSRSSLVTRVARGQLVAGLVVPANYDAMINEGKPVQLSYVAGRGRFAGHVARSRQVRARSTRRADVCGRARDRAAGRAHGPGAQRD